MGVRFRDDVVASFRLARAEWWLPVDLLAGVAGYVVWVAGSAALGLQLASLADIPVAPDGVPTTPVLATVGLLWLVLPAAVGVARLRSRLLNIRGNVEQAYRFDRPGALLVPPAVLVALLLAGAMIVDSAALFLFVALVPATLYLLVRTTAFAYRVFALSVPLVVYAGLFATLVVQAGVLVLALGLATENTALVEATAASLGLPVDPFATVEVAALGAPAGLIVATAVPIAVAVGYVLLQTLGSAVVRVRKPTVRPSRVRTGQRYPPGLEVTSNGSRTTSTKRRTGKQTPASKAPDESGNDDIPDGDAATAGAAASSPSSAGRSASTGSASTGSASTGSDHGATDDGADDETVDDEATAADDADSVSHTRVFTPPGGGGDDPLAATTDDGPSDCPDCGATVPADAEQCPACGAEAP